MKTTVKHVGSVREWEGDIDQWTKHETVIRHWSDGGDSERQLADKRWVDTLNCNAWLDTEYRIKQREPKTGEVWTHPEDGEGLYYVDTLTNHGYMIELGVQTVTKNVDDEDGFEGFVYTAPSVEAYYARKSLERYQSVPIDSLSGEQYKQWLTTLAGMEK